MADPTSKSLADLEYEQLSGEGEDITIGTVEQGAAGTDPWKVDDDATQTAIAALQTKLTDGSARVGGNVEVVNDVGSPLPVSGTVEVVNDVGNALPVNGTVEVTNDVGNPLPVSGQLVVVSSTLTRPGAGDVNAYAAKDVLADSTSAPTVQSFANVPRANAGSGYITKLRCVTNLSSITPRLRVHLFHTAPTALNDNAAYTFLDANKDKRIGYVDLPALATEGTGSDAAHASLFDLRMPFVCAAASRSIFYVPETLDAFTPTSGQTFFFEITADLN